MKKIGLYYLANYLNDIFVSNANNSKLQSVQILRFVAAFLVLFGHLLMEAKKVKIIDDQEFQLMNIFPWGIGVDLFFIISGFIISHVMLSVQPKSEQAKSFILRRLIRIVPIYWFYTSLMVLAMMLFSSILKSNKLEFDHLIASIFFIPWPHPTTGAIRPVLGQGWTLNYEMFFYACAALSLFLTHKWRKYFLTLIILFTFLLSQILFDSSYIFKFFGYSIILEFLIGIWLYEIFIRIKSLPDLFSIIFILLGIVLCVAGEYYLPEHEYRALGRGIPALLLAFGLILSNKAQYISGKLNRILALLGDSSYSLYLSHPFILIPFAAIWLKIGIESPTAFVILASMACIIFSVFSFDFIERPMISFFSKHTINDSNKSKMR